MAKKPNHYTQGEILEKKTYLHPEFVKAESVYHLSQRKMNGNKVFKSAQNVFFSAQNVLDPLLSLYMYSFILLLKDQKIVNLRRMKNY